MTKNIVKILICILVPIINCFCNGADNKSNISEVEIQKPSLYKKGIDSIGSQLKHPLFSSKEIKITEGEYSLIIKTTCFLKDTLVTEGTYNEQGAIQQQDLYFIYKADTIRKIGVPSDIEWSRVKGSGSKVEIKTNAIKSVSLVRGKNDFFYYFTGKEDCEFPCNEYWGFYSKSGLVLWQQYKKEEGSYIRSVQDAGLSDDIYSNGKVKKTIVYPLSDAGRQIPSSLIKPARK